MISTHAFGTYRTGEQRVLRRALHYAQSLQGLRFSQPKSMEEEEGPGKNLDLKHRLIRLHLKKRRLWRTIPKYSMMALNDRISKATSACMDESFQEYS